MRILFSWIAAAALVLAQDGPDQALQRARAKILEMAGRLDRYVCVETVNRSYYTVVPVKSDPPRSEPAACADAGESDRTLLFTDRLRVEVTAADSRELHSWPGA